MNYYHQSTFSSVQSDSVLYKGSQEARNTHSSKNHSKLKKLVPGDLAWALSFILNKIYEIHNTIDTKTLVPSLLICSWADPGSIIRSKSP